jgi:tetraprenyl-beta-curcumene synthase
MAGTREVAAVCWALGRYRSQILLASRRQLRGWEGRAAAIPDPELRRGASEALRLKGRNPEATAVFALLAPRRSRATVLRAGIALQVAVDYLDELTERPGTSLETSLDLHRVLVDAVRPTAVGNDSRRAAELPDGGYLEELVETCRRGLLSLPAAGAVLGEAQLAAARCGAGQGHTHAGGAALRGWAEAQPAPAGYRWWEVAAGASSSVSIHALIAAAADPATNADDARCLDAAYFPPIGALTVLLDDLVDLEADLAAGQHNYLAYHPDRDAVSDRLGLIAGRALGAIGSLRQPLLHLAILAGVAGFYLSAPEARTGYGEPARERLLETIGPAVRPVLIAMRLTGRG